MIFIGAELGDPHAHFVTNIIECISSGNDLIIDLLDINESEMIFREIDQHLKNQSEQFIIYNAYTDEDFFVYLKERFPKLKLIIIFSDDEWRHSNYDRYLALYSDVFTIAVKENLKAYKKYGLEPFYMQWACNPNMFYPLPEQDKDIDVSFIGAAYGQRVAYIKFLIVNGVKVKVFGRGWDQYADILPYWGGYLTHKEMLVVISRSKINLNFLWTSAEKERSTIKGRTLELSACCSFQLSNYTYEFENYGFVNGENIALFNDQQEIIEKISYYLQHDDERDVIAERAYKHALKCHTWQQRFHAIFECLQKRCGSAAPIRCAPKILVIAGRGIQHQINVEDERLAIRIVDSVSDWHKAALVMDGVIHLDNDSTLNNEALYMMVFGLVADKSDAVVSNFYVGGTNNNDWIRIIDRLAEKKRAVLRMLPASCLMFSGKYAADYGCEWSSNLPQLKVSYVEHPSFWIKLPYYKARKLRLYFAYHVDSRKKFKAYIRNFNFNKAVSLSVDKIWQNTLKKRLGV